MSDFHLLRPEWLLALIPLLIAYWLLHRLRLQNKSWQRFCDQSLLPYLFKQQPEAQTKRPLYLLLLAGLLAITALSGPSWEKRPQPVFKQQSALVIALDLSRSMDATDIKPTRLSRALLKLEDILTKRQEGQTALIVYAGNAFTVTPLTEDTDTISSQIKSLSTDIMPVQGSRADQAVALAYELFNRASQQSGHIILVTDGIDQQSLENIKTSRQSKFSLSVLGVGTVEGAPIPLGSGGFFKDATGAIVIPKLNPDQLQQLALVGSGSFRQLTTNDSDIQILLQPLQRLTDSQQSQSTELTSDSWIETGPWLLLLLMPLAAIAFRKGYLFFILIFILPVPEQAHAFEWQQLWKNNNQQAQELLKQNKAAEAAETFSDEKWKAAAEYKAGQFDKALKSYQQLDSNDPDILYNLANAQAQLGQLDQALENYNKVIEKKPDHADARHNRDLIEKLKQQQQNNQQKQDQKNQNKSSDSNQQKSDNKNSEQTDNGSESQENKSDKDNQNKQGQQNPENKNADAKDEKEPSEQNTKADTQPDKKDKDQQQQSARSDNTLSKEQQQANEQWLRKIPDDPGGLLRRKFRYQTQQNPPTNNGEQQW